MPNIIIEKNRTYINKPCHSQVNWGHPLAFDLVGGWLFNEGIGSSIRSIVSPKNNGKLVGTPAGSWVMSPHGKCIYQSDNNTKYVSCGAGSMLDMLPTMTLMIHVNMEEYANGAQGIRLFSKNSGSNDHLNFRTGFGTAGNMTFRILNTSSGTYVQKTTGDFLAVNRWYQIVATWDGTTLGAGVKIYANGIDLGGTGTDGSGTRRDETGNNLLIGGDTVTTTSRSLQGKINYAYVWRRVLTPREIKQLHTSPFTFINPLKKRYYFTIAAAADNSKTATASNAEIRVIVNSLTASVPFRKATASNVEVKVIVSSPTASIPTGVDDKTATAQSASLTVIVNSPSASRTESRQATAGQVSASVVLNSATASRTESRDSTAGSVSVSIILNSPTSSRLESRSATAGAVSVSVITNSPTASLPSGTTITIHLVLRSQISKHINAPSRIDKYLNMPSEVDKYIYMGSKIDND